MFRAEFERVGERARLRERRRRRIRGEEGAAASGAGGASFASTPDVLFLLLLHISFFSFMKTTYVRAHSLVRSSPRWYYGSSRRTI